MALIAPKTHKEPSDLSLISYSSKKSIRSYLDSIANQLKKETVQIKTSAIPMENRTRIKCYPKNNITLIDAEFALGVVNIDFIIHDI
uniref:Uncharacterized protein n=1 Tax=Romanomermis culicivorax TaxID=13658 RepID=A0A915HEA4_ROMCU